MSEPGAAVRVPPPLLYLISVGLGVALELGTSVFSLHLPLMVRIAGAAAAATVALVFIVKAIGKFNATGQDPKPWLPSPEIITTGIYSVSRNPMYVALTLVQMAIGIGMSSAWVLGLAAVSLLGVYLVAVRHEEAYLDGKFGEAYRDYKRSVRRWI